MSEHEISSMTEGLTDIVYYVEILIAQSPSHYRSGGKIYYLQKAVLGYEWYNNPIRNIVSSNTQSMNS